MAIVKISDLPLVDQPVEGTDLFVVVQDNVTKKAYASDIQTYVGFEEIQYATAGQTVFNLTTMTYAAGANNLMVFVDGVNQYEGSSYVETDNNTVTFTQGLHQGALVKFSTVQTQTSLVNSAGAITYTPAGSNAVTTNVQTRLRQLAVMPEDFGAVGDGVADDTAAVQSAINYCIGTPGSKTPIPLTLTGKYRITASLNIDMPVGAQYDINGFFLIQGNGAGAGFYVNSNINMFSTTLSGSPSNPPAKNIQFENVTFTASTNTLATAYVLDDVFINVRFISCTFQKIKCVDSTSQIYLYLFQNCNMLSWKGTFFKSYVVTNGPTTIKFLENWLFDGEYGINIGLGCPSFVCNNNTFEGLQYNPIVVQGPYGGTISGNHFENNALTSNDFSIRVNNAGSTSAEGFVISGNYFNPETSQRTNPSYYDIDARFAIALSVHGNFTAGEQLIRTANANFGAISLLANTQGAVPNQPVFSAKFSGVQSTSQYSYGWTIADDAAVSFPLDGSGGVIIVSAVGTNGNNGIVSVYPAATPNAQVISAQANIAVTTGILSGTTGTDGKLTVSAASNGRVYIENRIGGQLNVAVQVLAITY